MGIKQAIEGKVKSRRLKKTACNAMIVVERKRKRIFCNVPREKLPANSFERNYYGEWIHVLGLDLSGKLWPIGIEEAKPVKDESETSGSEDTGNESKSKKDNHSNGRNHLPTDLYMAKHCATEVEEVYGISMPLTEKIKLGIFVGLCILITVVIFLIVSASGSI